MTRTLEEIIFQTRVLAQGHPFSRSAQAYLNSTVARERTSQPTPEVGIMAGHAITVGYCLRRVEEEEMGKALRDRSAGAGFGEAPEPPEDLDTLSTELAEKIRTDGAQDLFLYPEPLVIDALDHLIGGEVERRLSHWAETIDEETFTELEGYIAWWTVKGYALRIAERRLAPDSS